MLQNDFELWEITSKLPQVLQKVLFRIQDGDVLGLQSATIWLICLSLTYLLVIARDLAVKVEYHSFFFQCSENGVVRLVRLDSGGGMRRDTSRIRFDSCPNAGLITLPLQC